MSSRPSRVPGLRLNGARVQLARHPNGDPERQGKHTFPSGWNSEAVSWLPGQAASRSCQLGVLLDLFVLPQTQVTHMLFGGLVILPEQGYSGIGDRAKSGRGLRGVPILRYRVGRVVQQLSHRTSFWCNPR